MSFFHDISDDPGVVKYTKMQEKQYENDLLFPRKHIANKLKRINLVVGNVSKLNKWEDFENYLFKDVDLAKANICLDFGCGPGRNIQKFNHLFDIFDGVDISQPCLDHAKLWLTHHKCDMNKTTLYKCNGSDLRNIENEKYDVVMSTIALQHICVHKIRLNYFKEFFRVLKTGGILTVQMGYDTRKKKKKGVMKYFDNHYDASSTNGNVDVVITNVDDLKRDLNLCGYTDFKYYLRDPCSDTHDKYIYFNCKKG